MLYHELKGSRVTPAECRWCRCAAWQIQHLHLQLLLVLAGIRVHNVNMHIALHLQKRIRVSRMG
jgi:hypothetical protein